MRTYTAQEIIELKPKMKQMLEKEDLGALMQFRHILKMSDGEIADKINDVNDLLKSIPLNYAETMRKKYGLDLDRRYFDEEAHS